MQPCILDARGCDRHKKPGHILERGVFPDTRASNTILLIRHDYNVHAFYSHCGVLISSEDFSAACPFSNRNALRINMQPYDYKYASLIFTSFGHVQQRYLPSRVAAIDCHPTIETGLSHVRVLATTSCPTLVSLITPIARPSGTGGLPARMRTRSGKVDCPA